MGYNNNNIVDDELVHEILQEAWTKLLQVRKEGKIPYFDSIVPAKILSWLEDIWEQQITTLRVSASDADDDAYERKLFSIAISYRLSIEQIVGLDYFLNLIKDKKKMKFVDDLVSDIRENINKDNAMKRLWR